MKLLNSNILNILLWEQVLKDICDLKTDFARCLGDLSKYYESLELEGSY